MNPLWFWSVTLHSASVLYRDFTNFGLSTSNFYSLFSSPSESHPLLSPNNTLFKYNHIYYSFIFPSVFPCFLWSMDIFCVLSFSFPQCASPRISQDLVSKCHSSKRLSWPPTAGLCTCSLHSHSLCACHQLPQAFGAEWSSQLSQSGGSFPACVAPPARHTPVNP